MKGNRSRSRRPATAQATPGWSAAGRGDAGEAEVTVTLWDLDARITRLAGRLAATGTLSQPHWRHAIHAVPGHLFVPAVAWAGEIPLDRATDPGGWLDAVYSDVPLVTQIDDGAADVRGGNGLYSSSCSAPGAVTDFLERLDPQPGDRVLEIGTGTGWTAALLSWRVGQENVTSIEIDPAIAARAAANLKASGYAPGAGHRRRRRRLAGRRTL